MNADWSIPQPSKVISINELAGKHPMAFYQHKRYWEEAGYWHGQRFRSELRKHRVQTPLTEKVAVQFDFDMRSNRRRDGHNYAGTVCKWFIDGLVTAKFLADDSTEHVALLDSTFTTKPKGPLEFRMTVMLT